MNYEITGTVHTIHPTQDFPSGFSKREFVVTTDEGKYPQEIKLEAVKDKCGLLDAYQPGDPIVCSFNIRGNEYNGKHYVNLVAWKFDRASGRPATITPPTPPVQSDITQDADEIPF